MKKIVWVILVLGMVFLVSCEKNRNIISYSAGDVPYFKCVEEEKLISGFPNALVIMESAEQLEFLRDTIFQNSKVSCIPGNKK